MRRLLAWAAAGVLTATVVPAAGCARRDRSVVYAQPEGAPARARGDGGLRIGADLEMRVGNPRGHIQIPKGGQPGTTSIDRPTYDELGIDAVWGPALDLTFGLGCHRLRLGGAYWVLHGDATLREALTSHEDFYPAGTHVTSASEVGETWLSYGYAFPLSRAVTVTPALGVYGFRNLYEIHGGGNTSDREFHVFSPMFETEVLWRTGGRMHVSLFLRLVLDDLLGGDHTTNVVDAQVRWHLDLWSRGSVHLAAGATSISHRDAQPVPNEILLEVLPWFGLGGEVRF